MRCSLETVFSTGVIFTAKKFKRETLAVVSGKRKRGAIVW